MSGKIFDAFDGIGQLLQSNYSPAEAVQLMMPDGVDVLLQEFPTGSYLEGDLTPEKLLGFFGCSDEEVQLPFSSNPEQKLVFAEESFKKLVARTLRHRGIHSNESYSNDFDSVLVPEIIVGAAHTLLENAADEIERPSVQQQFAVRQNDIGLVKLACKVIDGSLEITVEDNAFGIAREVVEAWGSGVGVTTKKGNTDYLKQGTGAGLINVLEIIRGEGGNTTILTGSDDSPLTLLSLDSTGQYNQEKVAQHERHPRHGTKFTLKIPYKKAGALEGEFS